jgi:hypothetical protein
MGKKHRRIRTLIKSELREMYWFENEFGELKRRLSKGEARRHLWGKRLLFYAEDEIMKIVVERARKEILEEEDKRIL